MKTPIAAAVILVVTAGCTPGGTLGVLENARFSLDLPGHDTRTPIAEGATFSAGAFAEPCYELFSSCPDIAGSLRLVSDTPSVIAPASRVPGLECLSDVDCLAGSLCDDDGVCVDDGRGTSASFVAAAPGMALLKAVDEEGVLADFILVEVTQPLHVALTDQPLSLGHAHALPNDIAIPRDADVHLDVALADHQGRMTQGNDLLNASAVLVREPLDGMTASFSARAGELAAFLEVKGTTAGRSRLYLESETDAALDTESFVHVVDAAAPDEVRIVVVDKDPSGLVLRAEAYLEGRRTVGFPVQWTDLPAFVTHPGSGATNPVLQGSFDEDQEVLDDAVFRVLVGGVSAELPYREVVPAEGCSSTRAGSSSSIAFLALGLALCRRRRR